VVNDKNKRSFVDVRKRSLPKNIVRPIVVPERESLSLEQAVEFFVQAKRVEGVRDATIKGYYEHISYLLDYMTEREGIALPLLSDLDSALIRRYIHYLLHDRVRYKDSEGRKDKTIGLSPTTVNIRLRTLRTMCRFWHKEGMTDSNAMENIKPVKTDEVDEVRGFTDEEISVILNSLDDTRFADWRDKVLILLLLDTGLRPSEACSLTIDRVDFITHTLSVPSKIAKNRRNREVPLSREVSRLLKELYEESLEYFGETEYVFNNAYGDPFNADTFRKRLNRLKKRIGMERISPNMFRQTFCRKYIINGGDIFTLQKIVDHADIQTTRKYIQMDMTDIRGQHNKYSPVHRILKRK